MDTVPSLRDEIIRIREETDQGSCHSDEKLFGEARAALLGILDKEYGGSYVKYVLCCMLMSFAVLLTVLLLYTSAKMITEWMALRRISRQMRCHSIILQELRSRELSQASRRTARRRTTFVIALKCLIASSLLLFFVGSRVMMEVTTRGWLKNLLVSPGTNAYFTANGDHFDPWFELYSELATLLSVDWFRDIQGLFAFSMLGSSVMVVGLRLLRSASEDVVSMRTDSISSMQLLQKIDDKHAEQGQVLMQKQLESLLAILLEHAALQPDASTNGGGETTAALTENAENTPREVEADTSAAENDAQEEN